MTVQSRMATLTDCNADLKFMKSESCQTHIYGLYINIQFGLNFSTVFIFNKTCIIYDLKKQNNTVIIIYEYV